MTGETLFAKRSFEVPRVPLQCGLPITLLGVCEKKSTAIKMTLKQELL